MGASGRFLQAEGMFTTLSGRIQRHTVDSKSRFCLTAYSAVRQKTNSWFRLLGPPIQAHLPRAQRSGSGGAKRSPATAGSGAASLVFE
jgi:hypothetical protein